MHQRYEVGVVDRFSGEIVLADEGELTAHHCNNPRVSMGARFRLIR